jgi:hypothetical protein
MSKRYTFWRTPTGKPYRGTDGKHAPAALLASLGESATVKEGQITWTGFGMLRIQPVLRGSVAIIGPDDDELNDEDAWSIVRPAIAAAIKREGGGNPVTPAAVIREADARAAEHFRLPVNRYVLVTTLSIKSLPVRRIRVRDCVITSLRSRSRYKDPQALVFQADFEPLLQKAAPKGYQLVRIDTFGRTVHEGTLRALAAIDMVRGLWTLFATYGSWSISSGGPRQRALGAVRMGPVRTLHLPDGRPADDLYWYDPAWVEERLPFEPRGGWRPIEKSRRWAMIQLKSLPYRPELEALIIRYAAALDHADSDLSLLQMWGLLEKMTDTVGANYDETIRRAMWVYKDRPFAKEALEGIRLRRNLFVHAARSGDVRDQFVYLIKSFVDPHLLYLLRNDFAVTSLEEYGAHLSLPAEPEVLEKQRKQRSHALRLLRTWGRVS